ncbi:MAG TPA: alpha/beta fold hydrolase [Smithellaceae bacterium]|nr:alpha/beta fold hydrolase [Smithellaceae bacterium]
MNQAHHSQTDLFQPGVFIGNRHVQSVLASSHLLIPPRPALEKKALPCVLQTSEGSKLLAFVTRHPNSRGTFILLHGWEGSSSSAYIIAAGGYFYRMGFSVARLNLRDHGASHHLNQGLFHGALIQETFEAVRQLSGLSGAGPAYILGFSLGANFALRIAIRHARDPIPNLKEVFAVSPPLDPYKTTLAIDAAPAIYRKYFLRKWKRSLQKKEKLFPHLYRFSALYQSNTCMDLTEKIMAYYPEFQSYRDYFGLYTLGAESFKTLSIPVSIFIASDDPVIPADDYSRLEGNDYLKIYRLARGGHCGFITLFPYTRWYNETIAQALNGQSRVEP